ncbi:hypothetical protein ACFQL7_28545 [Halocatena marina]|uniref:Glycine zipper-like domain-containing protein n=1 Tax=Halocatena marina TaxID=2934937 RepID=A0ABD5YYL4_9EURY
MTRHSEDGGDVPVAGDNETDITSTGLWMGIGVAVGVAIGAVMGDVGLGIIYGILIGVAMGAIQVKRH